MNHDYLLIAVDLCRGRDIFLTLIFSNHLLKLGQFDQTHLLTFLYHIILIMISPNAIFFSCHLCHTLL
jgi:hypothetical protein